MEKAQEWFDYGIELSKEFGPKLLTALIIYIVGMWVVKKIIKGTRKVMSKSKYDESLQKFLLNLFSWALKIFLIIIVISRLGVDVTTFAAVIAAAGLAVGLALQGFLSNFAGGVLIMIFKPYKIGDLIEAQGVLGKVKGIEIFTTKLVTPQSRLAIVPNGAMANVLELADSSVNFAVRPFCEPDDYWDVYFDTYENSKLALDEAGIEIPYPHQVEIHKNA